VRLRFDPDDERCAVAVWSRIAEPGDLQAWDLARERGPVAALRQVIEGTAPAERWQVRLADADPLRDLATVRRFGGRLVVPGDAEWPAGLDDLHRAAGRAAPFCLWVRGPADLAQACSRSVSVVGARAATPYGERISAELGSGCADAGVSVISGAAYGIDGAAHRGALAVSGSTVAVLACGVDRAYPRGHEQLIERIASEGSVVSEVPPGSAPTRNRFVERNRVIAALGQATVVVEAAWRSGASVTASRAADLGRPLAAVPGPVSSPMSAGCHRLLRTGAVCVTTAAEVLELLAPIGELLADEPVVAAAEHDGLSPADVRVLDALPVRRPAALGSLALVAGLTETTVLAALGRLELRGSAVREAAGWRRPTRQSGSVRRSGAGA
jgi:DNA processing protein